MTAHSLDLLRSYKTFLPPAEHLDTGAIDVLELVQTAPVQAWMTQAFGDRRPDRVCVDLDDTCLHNSVTTPSLWDLGGYYDPAIVAGFRYRHMRRDLAGRLRQLRGRPAYDQCDKTRYPFLQGPRVIAAPSLPMLQMLYWLKENGTQLALVSASAQARVAHLCARLPILSELFGAAIYCAEDIVARTGAIAGTLADPGPWHCSAALHQAAPNTLIAKTPLLVAPLFEGQSFDVLIDDSVETGQLFEAHGLGACVIRIDHDAAAPPAAWTCVRACVARMTGTPPPEVPAPLVAATQVIRFEDPLYYPLLHVSSRFA